MNALRVLAVDIGGTNVKILATGQEERRRFPSGKELTPQRMVRGVQELASGWEFDVVSIGYPGRVAEGRPVTEPGNLARGWVGFDYAAAFERPAIPPVLFGLVVEQLGNSGCATGARVVVEKPFGTDLASARALNRILFSQFPESSIFRIDHYLGKRPVINMLSSAS